MDIKKAKRMLELTHPELARKILVTQWDGMVSSCIIEDGQKQTCEACQTDEETCQEWLNQLVDSGYTPKELPLSDIDAEESLSRFEPFRKDEPSTTVS